ncbi:MAG: dienelactone hydrolase family protein [Candidatus Latescibacteria bacterium]|nr:dienelactone hydrolase family protein [Candidatus Latescibacterota bacterium]
MVTIDEDGAERPVVTADDWARRRRHILASMELVMGPLPDRKELAPLDMKVLERVELGSVVRMKVTFVSEPGDRVPAYLIQPKKLSGKVAGVLCLHQTTEIGKGEPAGIGGKPNLHYALELAERGYVALAPDYPYFGDNDSVPFDYGYVSTTMKGIWNHMRGVDLLQSLPEVVGANIGCIGHSLGGHNTVFVSVFDERIGAMVSSCGFNAFPKYKEGDLKAWGQDKYMPRVAEVYGADPKQMPFDFTELTGALAPRAFFVNAPLGDSNFEVSGVRDCIAAAIPVYELVGARDNLVAVYPDAGHDFPPEIREQAYTFLNRHLGMGK